MDRLQKNFGQNFIRTLIQIKKARIALIMHNGVSYSAATDRNYHVRMHSTL